MSTTIEWTDATWNPVTGCTKVSQGCKHCYAEGVAERFWGTQYPPERLPDGSERPRRFTDVRCHPDRLGQPLSWRRPRRVFVNSMSDLFHEDVPDEFILAVWAVMEAAPQHTYQILTKRPERMRDFLADSRPDPRPPRETVPYECREIPGYAGYPDTQVRNIVAGRQWAPRVLPSVWLGVSVEDQATTDERVPLLLKTPAAVRFLSAEPLLGPVDLGAWLPRLVLGRNAGTLRDPENADLRKELVAAIGRRFGLGWVIIGGESGPGARPMHLSWARLLVEQCWAARIPCFVKQLGRRPIDSYPRYVGAQVQEFDSLEDALRPLPLRDPKGGDPAEWPRDLRVREWPT